MTHRQSAHVRLNQPDQRQQQHAVAPGNAGEILQQQQPEAAVAPAHRLQAVAQKDLGPPLRPAQPLLVETAYRLRHQHPAERLRLIVDEPASQLQLPADVDILGHHVIAPATDRLDRLLAKGHHHPGDGKDSAVDPLGPLDEADDGAELAGLDLADDSGAGAHPRVAGDRPDPRALDEVLHHPAHRVIVEHRIPIDADQDLPAGHRQPVVERHRLALVVLVEHGQARILLRQSIQPRACVVLAAIVDGQHLEIGIALAQQVADGLLDVGPLVVAGHHQGHSGVIGELQPPLGQRDIPSLPLEVVIETTTNPHHGHQTGIGQRKDGYPFQKILHRIASPGVALAALTATGVAGSWVG